MKDYRGLTDSEVENARKLYGWNRMTAAARKSWWLLYLEKFSDPIIKLLIFAAVLSIISGLFTGHILESVGIILAIFLSTFIAFINEYEAGKEFDILNRINEESPVKVIRNGVARTIPKTQIVPGDILILESGDLVPADCKVLESLDFYLNESTFNGESKPAHKDADQILYNGTSVLYGSGIAIVEHIGDDSTLGNTARRAMEHTGNKTPLQKQLDSLGSIIGKVGFVVSALLFITLIVRSLVFHELVLGFTWDTASIILGFLMIAITIIVVAVPEGLPMSVTLSLAYSMKKMARENMLVRKLHACQTIGAATVICTDKTGTLTQNIMALSYSSLPKDKETVHFLLNSTAVDNVGSPTELALIRYIESDGINQKDLSSKSRLVSRIPFSSRTKFMASLIEFEGRNLLLVKGAPEVVSRLCSFPHNSNEYEEYAAKGMRTIAFASCELNSPIQLPSTDGGLEAFIEICKSNSLSYDGFCAIEDPIRQDVPQAMAVCRQAGVRVIMVTGDNKETALEIARQCYLLNNTDSFDNEDCNYATQTTSGSEFAALDEQDAGRVASRLKVMYRATPEDKLKLVKALQRNGEVVAVTGDGTNDAPALNYADVGLSMGSGTFVAKEASDIVLLDDSFSSIVNAIKWGRTNYLNIQKFLQFQLTINLVALTIALTGPFIGIEFPLTVTQMLWVNLIMDTFAALALAGDAATDKVMMKTPRSINSFIINREMLTNISVDGIISIVILLHILLDIDASNPNEALLLKKLTAFFTVFVMLGFWNMFNARILGNCIKTPVDKLNKNWWFVAVVFIILVCQILIVEFGGEFFRTTPLDLRVWVRIICGTFLLPVFRELLSLVQNKR